MLKYKLKAIFGMKYKSFFNITLIAAIVSVVINILFIMGKVFYGL